MTYNNFEKQFTTKMAKQAINENQELPKGLFDKYGLGIEWINWNSFIWISMHLARDSTLTKRERKEERRQGIFEPTHLTKIDLQVANQLSRISLINGMYGHNGIFISKYHDDMEKRDTTRYHIKVRERYDGVEIDRLLELREMGYDLTRIEFGLFVVKRRNGVDEPKVRFTWNELVNKNIPFILTEKREMLQKLKEEKS